MARCRLPASILGRAAAPGLLLVLQSGTGWAANAARLGPQHILSWAVSGAYAAAAVLLLACTFMAGRALRGRRPDNDHYKEIIDRANDGVTICDAQTHRILYANVAIERRLGYGAQELETLTLLDLFALGEDSADALMLKLARAQPELPMSARLRCKDGNVFDVEVRRVTFEKSGRELSAYTTRDVSVSKKAELQLFENQQRLARIAHHDQLTGLPNRHFIASFLPDALEASKKSKMMLGILFLDLDRFKHINDTYGHETGDKLLRVVADRLRECVREADIIVRMGGDEFVIVFLNVQSEEEVTRGAARVVASLSAPIVVDSRSLQTSASVGISMFPRDGVSMVELLKHSDTAMYQAKDGGRNNVQIFSAEMNRRLKHRVAVEEMLRDAIRLRQLEVHYQPLVNLSSRKIIGLEALVRWRHPTRGMVPPDWFIPVAEETGLVIPIGNFVLHRALRDLYQWRAAGASVVPVSLNVAASQLLRGEYQATIITLRKTYDIPPGLLQLEMTERGIFDSRRLPSGETRHDTLAHLRDLGIKIAIDDFGTGYSSLAYLKHWQIDTLKIDKSFVRDLVTDASDLAIVSAIIAIARHLHIEVIAEGIEAYQQADILRNLGCHNGQGYLFGRPMPADKCQARLTNRPVIDEDPTDMLEKLELTAHGQ